MRIACVLLVAALATIAAGCGSKAGAPPVASLGTTTSHSTSSSIVPRSGSFLKFVNCLRAHGVQAQVGTGGRGVSINGGDPNSTQFQSAQATCQKYLPGGPPKALTAAQQQQQQLKQLLKLAKCMRSHGVPNFPDPSGTGASGFPFGGIKSEVSSPQFQKAAKACGAAGPGGGFAIKVRA